MELNNTPFLKRLTTPEDSAIRTLQRINYYRLSAYPLAELDKEVKRSQEVFIRHHVQKYEGRIPVWAAIEVLSFGALSKLYSNMKSDDQNQIARRNYRVPSVYL